jgi:transcription-repair coupling factor (superfamily II helicase)
MDKKDIDDVMEQFYSGELDLLLATSIIENGIDVRNANLMLVYDADHFGLSQLYQIKGRVGRGDKMAFAYLMINGRKELNDQAKKRLKSIQDFTELGSGYKIAQRDLLIRGAGDILGPQQAGFIDEVGVDMYIRLLNEAIEEKKTGIVKNNTPQSYTLLGVDAYIPSTYANDEDKIELYQKILEAKSLDKVEILRQEMRDIYGPLPQSSELLLTKRKIDILISEKICFSKIDEYPNHIMLVLSREFSDINGIGSSLFTALIRFINQIKISYNNKMLSISIEKNGTWLDFTLKIMLIIQQLYETYMKVEGKNED